MLLRFAVESGVKSEVRIGISVGIMPAAWRVLSKGMALRRELEFASRAFIPLRSTDLFIRCNDRRAIGAGMRKRRKIFSLASKARVSSPT